MYRLVNIFGVLSLLVSSLLSAGPAPEHSLRLIVQLTEPPAGLRVDSSPSGIMAAQQSLIGAARERGLHLNLHHSFHGLFNGLAVSVPASEEALLSALPGVKAVYNDFEVRVDLSDSVPLIGAPAVWTMTDALGHAVDGQGMRVAVIDTGVDYTHPDLGGCLGPACKVIGGYDFVNQDTNPFDDYGHGTHVAGIVAANGTLKGVAPGASLLAYKALDHSGFGYASDIIAALEVAADPDGNPATPDGAQVINLSLGGGEGSPDDALSQAVNAAVDQGIVVVASAGNRGLDYATLDTPGIAEKALTVAASTKADGIAGFSSHGPVSGNLDWLKPDLTAPGHSITSTVPASGSLGDPTLYRAMSGTSMSAPHVAGAAALILQLHPEWSPAQVKAALMNTSQAISQDLFAAGAGRIQVDKAAATPLLALPGSLSFGFVSPGSLTTRVLEVSNVSTSSQDITVTTHLTRWLDPYYQYTGDAPNGYLGADSPSFTLAGGATGSISVTLDLPADAGEGIYYGAVVLDYTGGSIHVPIVASNLSGNYPPNPNHQVNQIGGINGAMEISQDLAYVGMGNRMAVLSVMDKAHPSLLSQTEPGPGIVWALAAFSHYVAVHFTGNELRVYDVANPNSIFQVGNFPTVGVSCLAMRVKGSYLYMTVASGVKNELWVLNLIDPADPQIANTISLPHEEIRDLAVDENRLYIPASDTGVLAFDITDPANPVLQGTYNSPGWAYTLDVYNHLVILGDLGYQQPASLRVIDFSNPGSPHQVGSFDFASYGSLIDPAVTVQNGRAYVAMYQPFSGGRVFAVNLSNPAQPAYLADFASTPFPDYPFRLKAQDGYLYAMTPNKGMDIFDVRNLSAPVKLSRYASEAPYIRTLARQGNFLYLAQEKDLHAYDLSDPARPAARGICTDTSSYVPDDHEKIAVAGKEVYLATAGLKICDFSNPDAPRLVGLLDPARKFMSVAARDGYLYALQGAKFTTDTSYLKIYRRSGASTQLVGSLALGINNRSIDIAIKGYYAYLTTTGVNRDNPGVMVINIQDPAAPAAAGFLSLPGDDLTEITLVGDYAYLSVQQGPDMGLVVLDLSNPTQPAVAGKYIGGEHFTTVTSGGNYAFTSGGSSGASGMYVMDVSDPANPQKIVLYPDYCGSMAVAATGGLLYSSSWSCGMLVSAFSPRSTFTISGAIHNAAGDPIPGVYVTDSLGNLGITDSMGQYHIDSVLTGRNQFKPVKSGCSFNPPEGTAIVSANGSGYDFIADSSCPYQSLFLPLVRK